MYQIHIAVLVYYFETALRIIENDSMDQSFTQLQSC